MRLYPFNNYMRYLLCIDKPWEEISQTLQELGFVVPPPAYFSAYRNEYLQHMELFKKTVEINDKSAKAKDQIEKVMAYFKVEDIWCHFAGRGSDIEKKEFKDALTILQDSKLREIVEVLALKRLDNDKIAELISKNSIAIGPESVRIFTYYFWNIDGISFIDWRQYLKEIPEKREKYIRQESLFEDPEYIKFKLGLPASVDYTSMLSSMSSGLFFKFKELMNSSNVDDIVKAAKIGMSAAAIGEKLYAIVNDNKKNMLEDLQLNIEYTESEPPLLLQEPEEAK